MKWCNGLVVTQDGHVLVSEGEPAHCVSIWSPEGKRIRRWGDKQIFDYPMHLTIMPNGQIAVVNCAMNNIDNGSMRIFS